MRSWSPFRVLELNENLNRYTIYKFGKSFCTLLAENVNSNIFTKISIEGHVTMIWLWIIILILKKIVFMIMFVCYA
jgi:hypothetical protein